MNRTRHLRISLILAVATFIFGIVGYRIIEGWNFIDAIYMTAITLTTVGFEEVHTLSTKGQIFTVVLVLFGVGFSVYVAGIIVQFMVEGHIRTIFGRKRLDRKLNHIKNHYIICGYGRIGRVLCRHLEGHPIEIVVMDNCPELIPIMDEDNVLYVAGDATDEKNLTKAGIQRAKGLAAALGSDAENVFLVLTARQLNPDLFIVARAGDAKSKDKLKAAGANKVESPYEMGASSMAQRIIRPAVTSFLDLAFAQQRTDIQMEEIPVHPDSKLVNIMLKDSGIRQRFNLIIIAIKKENDEMLFNPSFESRIQVGDTVIAVGDIDNLRSLEKELNPSAG
ncbi:MAG: potassium channel protein [Deltaproteobacteria bacterium]|nr:MAG: potassium channel protein [Deltaproteobacteria bacterium]